MMRVGDNDWLFTGVSLGIYANGSEGLSCASPATFDLVGSSSPTFHCGSGESVNDWTLV